LILIWILLQQTEAVSEHHLNKKGHFGATQNGLFLYVPVIGLEPILPKKHDFESCASTNSATPASDNKDTTL
jgi:hypothetical protein